MSEPSDKVVSPPAASTSSAPPPTTNTRHPSAKPSLVSRVLSTENRKSARHFFSAYAQTWVGLSPIWLMGEAVTPGTKVGTKFKESRSKLFAAAEEVSEVVKISGKDIVVIVDSKLARGKTETGKTAEVLRAASDNAILVVTSSVDKVQSYLNQSKAGPEIRRSVKNNGRDVIILLDKALKHPIVVTGVSKFAKSKGIPHTEALLQLASLGLTRILRLIPEEDLEGFEKTVEELDAGELERSCSAEEAEHAKIIGQESTGQSPQIKETDPYAKLKKENTCIIS